jgi:hypothetical protein
MKTLMMLVLLASSTSMVDIQNLGSITSALGSGDYQALGRYFDKEVEISILGSSDFYSKSEAISKVKSFFQKYRPTSFSQVHNGKPPAGGAQYCIGDLKADGEVFRVYIYLKGSGAQSVIQELRFDKK